MCKSESGTLRCAGQRVGMCEDKKCTQNFGGETSWESRVGRDRRMTMCMLGKQVMWMGNGSCQIEGFGISGVQSSGFTIRFIYLFIYWYRILESPHPLLLFGF
jgi:hypothetical protein